MGDINEKYKEFTLLVCDIVNNEKFASYEVRSKILELIDKLHII